MYETPAPTHGFFPVVVVFWVYVGLAGAVAVGAHEMGASAGVAVLVFLVAAGLLLKPFLSVARRLMPTLPHETTE
ncbi:hypothetical protein [Halomarina ordinaria]|uniref:Uncharacterized protein n=1 Tax=Halomarina ordinaria TaxID=3033939 RepID=A0ABD5UAW7_9EURY|nr:hypothetical protein [Halomarina sp. PSRA2]